MPLKEASDLASEDDSPEEPVPEKKEIKPVNPGKPVLLPKPKLPEKPVCQTNL